MSLVSSLVNAFVQSDATESAKDAAVQSAAAANAEAKRQFDLQRGDLAPYRELGIATLPTIKGAYGLGTDAENAAALERFKTATPDYGFGFSEGERATAGALNASGVGLKGGGALKALTRYGQDYATTRFGNWRAGLGVPAGYGSNAVAQGNQSSQNYSDAFGANTRAAGDARASAYLRTGEIWGPVWQNFERSVANTAGRFASGAYGA
jgi:hypothetical protein